jgi:hypothetical protein
MIHHLKLVTNVVLGKNSGKEIEIVGSSYTESMSELLCFGVFLDSFLLVSLASNVHN